MTFLAKLRLNVCLEIFNIFLNKILNKRNKKYTMDSINKKKGSYFEIIKETLI